MFHFKYCGCLEMCSELNCLMKCYTVPHCSVETMKTVLVGLFCLMSPPTKMMSPPSNCVAAAKNRGTGRSPLDILTHELVLGEYMWTAEDGN